MNRSKQIAKKKGIKLNAFINVEYCYIWLGISISTSIYDASVVVVTLLTGFSIVTGLSVSERSEF